MTATNVIENEKGFICRDCGAQWSSMESEDLVPKECPYCKHYVKSEADKNHPICMSSGNTIFSLNHLVLGHKGAEKKSDLFIGTIEKVLMRTRKYIVTFITEITDETTPFINYYTVFFYDGDETVRCNHPHEIAPLIDNHITRTTGAFSILVDLPATIIETAISRKKISYGIHPMYEITLANGLIITSAFYHSDKLLEGVIKTEQIDLIKELPEIRIA